MLTKDEARSLTLFWGLCAFSVATEQGLELLPELD
jgi:hypothetical protein